MGLPQSGPFMFRSGGGGGSATPGSAGINYLSAIYQGDTLQGINTYNDGASAVPTNGTGGVVTGLTTTLNTSTPLVGTSSLRYSKDASNRQGMGWSYDFTIDRLSSDQSNPLFFQMYYRTSSAYLSNEMRLFLYDVTNGTLLTLNDISNNSGNVIAAPGDAQISAVGFTVQAATSYRLIWHIAGTSALAYDIDFDCFVSSPQTTQPGAIVADYGTEAWTVSNVGGSPTSSVRLTRMGNYVFASGIVNITGAASGLITLNIPAAYQASSLDYPMAGTSAMPLSWARLIDTGTASYEGGVALSGTNALVFFAGNVSATYLTPSSTAAAVPFTWANTDKIIFQCSWIVSGWAASAALSTTDTMFM